MPLPIKSRYTLQEAAKFIASATGERVTRSQVIDWGTQGFYGLYMLAYDCHVRYEDDNQISAISGSLVLIQPNATQAATLESGYSMKIDSGLHDGRKCNFMESGTSTAWRREQPASFNSTDLILLGTELVAFTATIAEPRQTAPAPDTAVPAPDGPLVTASDSPAPLTTAPAWSLITSLGRAPGYRWPLYQFLKAAHAAGRHCPKALDVLEGWKLNTPPELEVMTDGVKYSDGMGNTKEANLKAIQQAIKGLLQKTAG